MTTVDRLPEALILLGFGLGGVLSLEILVIFTPPVRPPLGLGPSVATVVTSAPLIALLVAGGYWLKRSDLDPDRYPRMAIWVGAGVGVLVVFFGLIAMLTRDSWLARLTMLRWAATTGAGGWVPRRAVRGTGPRPGHRHRTWAAAERGAPAPERTARGVCGHPFPRPEESTQRGRGLRPARP